jgi:tetratricopeptide (TPR) repeat protein
VLSIITGLAAKAYHAKQKQLGEQRYASGQRELEKGDAEGAVTDFRTALSYNRDNDLYQLRLAQASVAANHLEEARAYLFNLWERHPENAEVDMELGRLAARNRNVDQALRYYHNAICGDWQGQDAASRRRETRLELYQFLIHVGTQSQAQAELVALAAELPADSPLHNQIGQLFLKDGDYHAALNLFREALQVNRNDKAALAGAGETEFRLGNYQDALTYIERARKRDPDNTAIASLLRRTRLIVGINPYAPKLSAAEQSSRAMRMFQQALARLQQCTREGPNQATRSQPQTAITSVYEDAMKVNPRIQVKLLSRDPDLLAAAVDLAAKMENAAASYCGPPSGLDEAILLIARRQGAGAK